jgi:hypothetical protein
MNKDDQAKLYREQMGDEAADRQAYLAASTCPECGVRYGGHLPVCKRGQRESSRRARDEQNPRRKR